jgi:hypothetical protein
MIGNTFDSSWYADLTKELRDKICTCFTKDGWSRNPETEHWVCGSCRKPSRYCSIAICSDCETAYYMDKATDRVYEPLCPKCLDEGESKCQVVMVNNRPSLVIQK